MESRGATFLIKLLKQKIKSPNLGRLSSFWLRSFPIAIFFVFTALHFMIEKIHGLIMCPNQKNFCALQTFILWISRAIKMHVLINLIRSSERVSHRGNYSLCFNSQKKTLALTCRLCSKNSYKESRLSTDVASK